MKLSKETLKDISVIEEKFFDKDEIIKEFFYDDNISTDHKIDVISAVFQGYLNIFYVRHCNYVKRKLQENIDVSLEKYFCEQAPDKKILLKEEIKKLSTQIEKNDNKINFFKFLFSHFLNVCKRQEKNRFPDIFKDVAFLEYIDILEQIYIIFYSLKMKEECDGNLYKVFETIEYCAEKNTFFKNTFKNNAVFNIVLIYERYYYKYDNLVKFVKNYFKILESKNIAFWKQLEKDMEINKQSNDKNNVK